MTEYENVVEIAPHLLPSGENAEGAEGEVPSDMVEAVRWLEQKYAKIDEAGSYCEPDSPSEALRAQHDLWDVGDCYLMILLEEALMEALGLAKLDRELRVALGVAIAGFISNYRAGRLTVPGAVVSALRLFIWTLPQYKEYLTPKSLEIAYGSESTAPAEDRHD